MELTREERIDLNGWRKALNFKFEEFKTEERNLQNVHTPYSLCNEIISKLKENIGDFEGKTFCVFNIEFLEVLRHEFGVNLENVWFYTDCHKKALICKHGKFKGVNVMEADFFDMLNKKDGKTFDVVLGNPPYQGPQKNKGLGTLWDKFVGKSFKICKQHGFVALIHPSGWRNCKKSFDNAKILKNKQIKYLEIHGEQDGIKVFRAMTRYDWYIAQNKPITQKTIIIDQNGMTSEINLKDIDFIPNNMIDKVISMIAKEQEKRTEIINDSSYHTQRKHMSKEKTNEFKYPVIYSTPVGKPTIWYSSENDKGHFGISKIILNPSRPIGFVVDEKGEYGITEYCIGIVGDKKHLKIVGEVIKNQKTNGFAEFMESCHLTNKIFNPNIVKTFRKDFWKEFKDS